MGPIVVGIDGSLASERALCVAVGMAQREGGRVVAVHVRRPGSAGFSDIVGTAQLLSSTADACEEASLRSIAELCEPVNVPWEFRVRAGSPTIELHEVCRELRASILVVGSRGPGLAARWHRLTSGSVSTHLVRNEPTPVLVVR